MLNCNTNPDANMRRPSCMPIAMTEEDIENLHNERIPLSEEEEGPLQLRAPSLAGSWSTTELCILQGVLSPDRTLHEQYALFA